MAEAESNDSGGGGYGGGWFTGWIDSAKQKSAEALEFMKRDLAEFSTCVHHETSHAVAKTSQTLQEKITAEKTQKSAETAGQKVREGFAHFLGGITRALTIPPDDDDEETVSENTHPELFDRAKARLRAIQVDPDTYCNEPSGEEYTDWLKGFQLDSTKGTISELLVSNVEVRSLYTKLVPSVVSNADFWQRYFYKVSQLEQDEQRKIELKKRADKTSVHEDISWDDEWDENDIPDSPRSISPRKMISSDIQSEGSTIPQLPQPSTTTGECKPTVSDDETSPTMEQSDVPSVAYETKPENIQDSTGNTDSIGQESNDIRKTDSAYVAKEVNILVADESVKCENIQEKHEPETNENTETQELIGVQLADTTAVDIPVKKTTECETTLTEVPETKQVEEITPLTDDVLNETKKPDDAIDEPEVRIGENVFAAKENIAQCSSSKRDIPNTQLKVEVDALSSRVKGDLVLVGPGSDRASSTPSSESSGNNKELSSLGDDWERDFDLELTEEDIKLASEAVKTLASDKDTIGDEWEEWE